jgi:sulfonate transport system permease protein
MFVAAAELLGATNGLGFILDDGEQTGRPERVLAALLLFGLCGKITDWVLALGGRRLVSWQDIDVARGANG